jgi:Tol biopolymer transport system component
MIGWWLRLGGLLTGGGALLMAAALLIGGLLPARLLSYPHGDLERNAYFIHLLEVERGLEASFSPLPVNYCCLNWSPDGRYLLALTPAADGTPSRAELTLFDRQTRQPVWSSGNIGYTSGITTWSPDSRRVIFDSNAASESGLKLYMLHVEDGFRITPLLPESPYNLQLANSRAWSADGRWIIYAVRQIQTPVYYLYDVVRGESSGLPAERINREPVFSPVEARLAFIEGTFSDSRLLIEPLTCAVQAKAACPQAVQRIPLVPLAALQTWPTWSPDGEQLAYALGFGAASGIYWVDATAPADESRLLLDQAGDEWFLAWSPDGADLAYLGNAPGNDEVYRVHLASGRSERLTRNDHVDGPPAWVPPLR